MSRDDPLDRDRRTHVARAIARAKALQEAGDFCAAADAYRAILGADPALFKVLDMIGADALAHDQGEVAAALFQQAATAAPTAERWFQLSRAWRSLDRLADAEAAARRACALASDGALLHNHLALVLRDRGRIEEAIQAARRAVACAPDDAEAHVHLGTCLLSAGGYEEGFREYEWRARLKENILPGAHLAAPAWDGGPLKGRTILLVGEQGFGDTLQFCRYAPLVAAKGGRVVLAVQQALFELCRSLDGVATVIASGDPLPPFDTHVHLLSLPYLLGTTDATVPATVPYMRTDPARAAAWRATLDDRAGLRVGVAWQGNPKGTADKGRSIPFRHFLPLAHMPGVRLVSLQKGAGREQLADAPEDMDIFDAGARCETFADTAAVVSTLDLVIASDSAIAHLAGALAKPTWVALKFAPAWRWGLAGETTPWYTTARLFRQKTSGDWDGVFAAIAAALEAKAASA
jgi:tetratricopeptide (TPR) repeat protein